ncbi:MAG: hypothetical protein K6F86_02345 [Lachnospiraceae bacterium]|nr:hypothetical protein [Lachnospiraceae bacterium]
MRKRFRKQLSILLIIAMVMSMTCSVYADEVKDTPVMPGAGAGIEMPAVSEPSTEAPDETRPEDETTPSGDETAPVIPEEKQPESSASDNEPGESVSEDETLPVEEEGETAPEEAAGAEVTVSSAAALMSAVAAAPASAAAKITLTGDITLTGTAVDIDGGKNIMIDLNGHGIGGTGEAITALNTAINMGGSKNMENEFLISAHGEGTKLTLTDSSETPGSIVNNTEASDSVVAVWDKAELTAEKISIAAYIDCDEHKSALEACGKAIMVVGNVAAVPSGKKFDVKEPYNSKAVIRSGLKITDGYMGMYAIGNGAEVIVEDDTVNITTRSTCFQNYGEPWSFGTKFTINGGTFKALDNEGTAIYHAGFGNLTINGGNFTGSTGIEVSNGITVIENAVVSCISDNTFIDNLNLSYIANGSTTVGCGIGYSPYTQHTSYETEHSSLTIKGGTFSGLFGLYVNHRSTDPALQRTHMKVDISGGKFTSVPNNKNGQAMAVSAAYDTGVIKDNVNITGGSFNTKPDMNCIKDGYYAEKNGTYYEIHEQEDAYIRPALALGMVLKGQSLKQAGLTTALFDKNGNEITDAVVTGTAYVSTNDAGQNEKPVDVNLSCNDAGTYYIAAKTDTGFNISVNGVDKTGRYRILNASVVSITQLLRYTVEEIKEKDSLSLVQKKDVFYSDKIDNVYDYFTLYFIHGSTKKELTKSSGALFYWNGANTPSDSFDCSKMSAGTEISVSVDCLEKNASTDFAILRMPVYVTASKAVSSLVGDELTERYYGLISVYRADESGKMSKVTVVSGENVPIQDWFDSSSSVIDLTGISNARKYSGYKAQLKDLGKLKSDPNDDKESNYELMEKPWVTYNVEPSLILEFRDPSMEKEIAPTKIRRAEDTTPLTIYSFSNKQSTKGAVWCVKQVVYDQLEQCYKEEMMNAADIGIYSEPTRDEKGTKFTFDRQTFVEKIKKDGAKYTLFEIFTEEVSASDNNASLTVKALMPVVYNGNKYVAKDDTRYYSKGLPKSGYSPTLDIRVEDGGNRLSFGTDYTLTYKNNKNAGNMDSENRPTVIVTGKGIYSEMKIKVYFVILPADLAYAADVAVTTQYIKYNGKVLKPKVKASYLSGVNAGKTIPSSAYDISIYDEDGKDVTAKKFKTTDSFSRYTVVLTSNGSNPNISGRTQDPFKYEGEGESEGIFFYGIPKTSKKMTVGGTYKKVVYPMSEEEAGIAAFLDPDKFYAKTSEKKYTYQDVDKDGSGGSISVDLVDGKDECTAKVYAKSELTPEALNSGIYYLKVQFSDESLKMKYYVFEPAYVKVTYGGTKLKCDDITLKKKSFNFSSGDEYTDLTLKLSNRIENKGTEGIRLYIYQNETTIDDLSTLAEEGYRIDGSALSNNRAGRYRIRVEGTGKYYGRYDLTYTIGVQEYNKDKTPVEVFVNEEDGIEQPVPYRPDGQYDDSMIKVVWTRADKETKEVLKPKDVSGNEAGDYYVVWGTFKQVGPKKGTVTIVGTGTRFTGKIKRKFDVAQAE